MNRSPRQAEVDDLIVELTRRLIELELRVRELEQRLSEPGDGRED